VRFSAPQTGEFFLFGFGQNRLDFSATVAREAPWALAPISCNFAGFFTPVFLPAIFHQIASY
jgi:hypothetical protein